MVDFKKPDGSNLKVPIFMYHEVTKPKKIPALSEKIQYSFILNTNQFESPIRLLHDLGYESWSLYELISWLSGRQVKVPSKPVILTFDDGFEGNYQFALPILQKYGFKATFFVIVNKIGKPTMMTWDQLSELKDAGMSVQSHTMTHPLLSLLGSDEVSKELRNSKQVLEDRLSCSVDFVSLPYGSYNKDYKKLAINAGYIGG